MKRISTLCLLFAAAAIFSCRQKGELPLEQSSILVQNRQPAEFTVYSDPHSKKITLVYVSATAGKGIVSVYSSDGRLTDRKEMILNKGLNTWSYEIPRIGSGIYIVSLKINEVEKTQKIFKSVSY